MGLYHKNEIMKIAALCLLAVVVSAAPANDAPKTLEVVSGKPTPTSNATEIRYVKHAHRASLNFACPVDSIVVTPNFDLVSPDVADAITQIELEDHLGEVDSIQWGHTLQNYFLMVLGAIEAEQSVEFTPEDVEAKLKMYLTVMSKEKFFFSIDAPAIATFKKACGCPNLNIADPPDAKKELLLNATVDPASMGDEFFNKVIADASGYGLRPELVQSVLSAFFSTMWNKADPLHRRIKFALLKGDYDPKGFIMVKTPGYCNAQLLAPMISPELCGKQMGIYHGDASVLLRTEMAGVLLIKSPESKNAVVRKANEMAAAAVVKLLEGHTEPVYTVTFQGKE